MRLHHVNLAVHPDLLDAEIAFLVDGLGLVRVDPGPALRLLVTLKADGGRIVITVPDGAIDDFAGHVHFWSQDALRALLEPFGRVEIRRIQQVTLLALID